MPLQHLSSETLGETLSRARAIAEQSQLPAEAAPDLEGYLQAAEEVGVPREAMLQALREHSLIGSATFEVGSQVFAKSMDGFYYPGTVKALSDHTATVEFVSGGEHECAVADMRPLALVPGRKVQADVKDWGWYGCRVESYDPQSGKVKLVHDDWTSEKATLPLRKLRLTEEIASPHKAKPKEQGLFPRAALVRCSLAAGTVGVAVGVVLQYLLHFLK